ncbi:MAG: methyltransferase regulatory domain-containing protein [Bdellovibrionales bacterium]|jgi:hypothetical protein
MFYATTPTFDLSPVRLNYVAALRGVVPMGPEISFLYAQTGGFDLDSFLCLAASNPQGHFYGMRAEGVETAQATALTRKVTNATFVATNDQLPTGLNYLCYDQTESVASPQERETFFALAQSHLAASGLLAYRYRAYDNADESLSFLISEYAPEMSAAQAQEFLAEIKTLGVSYFAEHPIAQAALEKAITTQMSDAFFDLCGSTKPHVSGTLETMAGLLPREFSFVGDADFGANYLELAAPAASHEALGKCRDHLLYEPIKDFTLERLVRNDIWVKRPAEQTADPVALFEHFTFGITTPKERVPTRHTTQGGTISFATPLFMRLIDLMCTLPVGIGDFLSHPAGHGMDQDEVVAAIHVLVACGIAQPMRAHYEGKINADHRAPTWATAFNDYLSDTTITESSVRLASSIIGESFTLTAREALVLQAVHRVGLSLSAGALLPELQKLIQKNPALAAKIMDAAEPTDEVVHNIITDVVSKELIGWYAYGLLAA